MERLTNLARGLVRIQIVGPSPEQLLNLCAMSGISFWSAKPEDEFTLQITIHKESLDQVQALAERVQCTLKVQGKKGAPFFLRRFRKRYTLLAGLVISMFALLCSSLFIWEFEVTGNETISSAQILNILEEEGVGIGTYWPSLVSDSIRSKVLVKIPELSWMTVNVRGSRAEVIVRERVLKPELVHDKEVTHVLAEKSGIVTEMRVYRGTPLVKPGDTVVSGDVLVSATVRSALAPERNVRAMADVYARTWYEITSACPMETAVKQYSGKKKTKTALVIGDKRINFYLSGGIIEDSCDKIIKETKLALGDVFSLPVMLVQEQYEFYDTVASEVDLNSKRRDMEETLASHLAAEIGGSGEIVSTAFSAAEKNGLLYVTLRAECIEQIGAVIPMEQE